LIFGERLTRKGLRCSVLRRKEPEKKDDKREKITSFDPYHTHFKGRDIVFFNNEFDFLKKARKSRLIVSFTGSLIGALRKLWPLRHFLGLPPIINGMTGSDICELASERSFYGKVYRKYLRFVDLNWCLNYSHALKNIIALKVPNVVFMHLPYYLLNVSVQKTPELEKGPLRFFHPSHLDWKINDPGSHRYSSRGNDRFIRSFARASKNGLDAYCIIVDRGPDKEVAKDLIRELGIDDKFIWKPHLSREELFSEFSKADVVVDQFDVGGLGSIAIEAMSAGRPVLIYLQDNCQKIIYHDPPPVLNCHSEEEIYEKIMCCQDRTYLKYVGEKAKEWVYKYYNWDNGSINQFLFYYALLTGHKVVDYGWGRTP